MDLKEPKDDHSGKYPRNYYPPDMVDQVIEDILSGIDAKRSRYRDYDQTMKEAKARVTPYTDRDGNKRTRFEVVADEVEFGESRRAPEDQEAGSVAAEYMTNGQFEELGEEDPGDLPF